MAAHWHCIRLRPGAAQISRQDRRLTNIELSLNREGIEHYMPMERKELMHHRTKIWEDKRYPLIPGYAFVANVTNWAKLKDCDFVAGVLGNSESPIPIPASSIELIRQAETEIEQRHQGYKWARLQREREKEERKRHIPQSKARVLYPAGSTVVVDKTHFLLGGYKGRVVDATGRQTIKLMIETLNGIVAAELSMVHLERVA
jgi:transcription antitermination factor NusG